MSNNKKNALPTGFLAALKHCLGRPGQTLTAFRDEVNKLTAADKEWYRIEMNKVGYSIPEPNEEAPQLQQAA